MSDDLEGGLNYARLKRHYDQNDYASIGFNATLKFYTIGAMAFLTNPSIFDALQGWSLYNHGQPAVPPPEPVLAFGIPFWPSPVPAFEGKRIQMLVEGTTTRAIVRFGNVSNVAHLIPTGQKMVFFERTFVVFIQRAGATNGTLHFWAEG